MSRFIYLYLVSFMAVFTMGFPLQAKAVGHSTVTDLHAQKNNSNRFKACINTHQQAAKHLSAQSDRKLKGTDRHAAGMSSIHWSIPVVVGEPDNTIRKSAVCTVSFLYNKRGPPVLN